MYLPPLDRATLYETRTLVLLGRDVAVLHMALTELDIRLRRGMSNSGIEGETAKQIHDLRCSSAFHESDVSSLRDLTKNALKDSNSVI